MTIIKLGGCNGSGKTSVARALLNVGDTWDEEAVTLKSGKKSKVYHQDLSGVDVWILGKYDNACGGMDTIGDKHDRFDLVSRTATPDNIVFFEGLITGKTYGALGELSEGHRRGGIPWLYTFMDTPFDVCVQRVCLRRLEAGNREPFDPERTMRSTFNSCERLHQKLRDGVLPESGAFQHEVMLLNHKHKPARIADALLKRAMEVHNAR